MVEEFEAWNIELGGDYLDGIQGDIEYIKNPLWRIVRKSKKDKLVKVNKDPSRVEFLRKMYEWWHTLYPVKKGLFSSPLDHQDLVIAQFGDEAKHFFENSWR